MSEKLKLCQWDIKRADSAGQTERERERQERDIERQRDTENDKDTRRIQRSTEY